MRFKVELHPEVIRFVWYYCTAAEQEEFWKMCRRIAEAPIQHSEPASDPRLSRYRLRFFRFGPNIALFNLNRARTLIRIRRCRRLSKPGPPAATPPSEA